MPRKIAVTTLNASTIDILNVIRANADTQYQSLVPAVETANDIPKVGEVLYGYPAMANKFLSALVNRIATVRVQSATFNNPFVELKKGYLNFGETVEEIFVNIAKAVHFDPEKAPQREYKRTIPDVRSAFHVINWRVLYPVTIQQEDLRMAFQSAEGVQDLITRIINTVYTAAEYDEYLLFKYLLIKAISKGEVATATVTNVPGDAEATGKNIVRTARALSNIFPFMKTEYNRAGVRNPTPRERQHIFISAALDANIDVDVLAAAFNMDKAEFMGKRHVVDDWNTFDNERFDAIRAESDGLEEVTAAELAVLANVQAVILDAEWFQVYDNTSVFTDKQAASGLYWNYFYHQWKTVSTSPFANCVALTTGTATPAATIPMLVDTVSESDDATTITFVADDDNIAPGINPVNTTWIQTQALTTAGIGVHKYGALIIPASVADSTSMALEFHVGDTVYTATKTIAELKAALGTAISFAKQ